MAGILTARFLGADEVAVPVSCNTAVEKCGWFKEVRRTRIGSPYVIAAMQQAAAAGAKRIVGYEAIGGFLVNSNIELRGRMLRALRTRDAVIVILSIPDLVKHLKRSVSQLTSTLPQTFTASDRLKEFPAKNSVSILARFNTGSDEADLQAISMVFGEVVGLAVAVDRTAGLRITFANNKVLHLRPSGNAPEFRCYSEAATQERANDLTSQALAIVSQLA